MAKSSRAKKRRSPPDPSPTRGSARQLTPPLRAVGVGIVAVLTYLVLLAVGRAAIPDYEDSGYPLWAGVASIAIVVWGFVFSVGLTALRPSRESAERRRLGGWWAGAISAYVVFALAVSVTLGLFISGAGGADWLTVLIRSLAWIAAGPWIMLIWIGQEQVAAAHAMIMDVDAPAPADEFDPAQIDGPAVTRAINALDKIWDVIESSSLALAAVLSTAVINTGTLRTVRIANGQLEEEDFPAWWVLGLGVFFALVLVAVLAPIVARWRKEGLLLVHKALGAPRSGVPSESQLGAKDRLLRRIRVDRPLLLRPIAALSVLAPFLTAFVTSVVPTA